MSEEEKQAIIHLLDKQARYEYCIKNNISFSDEDYEAYIIRQSMINKDKEIERLNKQLQLISDEFLKYDWENSSKEQIINQLKSLYNSIFKGSDKE